jgi:hypothetical protein
MTPIYYESAAQAREDGCMDLYRESNKETQRTRDALDRIIAARFDGWRLDPAAADDIDTEGLDLDRVALVLAAAVLDRAGDGRFSQRARTWAAGVRFPADLAAEGGRNLWQIASRTHSAILNGIIPPFTFLGK